MRISISSISADLLGRSASVLEACVVPSSDTQLPFDCPADSFLDPAALEEHCVLHRPAGFLDDLRVRRFFAVKVVELLDCSDYLTVSTASVGHLKY